MTKHPPIDPYYVQEDDNLDEMAETLKSALEFTDDDLARLSPAAKNMVSGRRHLGLRWLDRLEIAVEITSSPGGSGCGVAQGRKFVFDMRHKVKPELSDAPLCVHLMSPVLSIFTMTFDRAAEGLHPILPRYKSFDCFDTGIDHGGTGKVFVDLHLRDAATQERVAP